MKKNGKKSFIILLSAVLFTVSAVPISFGASEADLSKETAVSFENPEAEVVEREYILTSDFNLRTNLQENGMPRYVQKIIFADDFTAKIKVRGERDTEEIRGDFRALCKGQALQVQPNYVYETARTDDPYYSLQWGLHNTGDGMDIRFDESYEFVREHKKEMERTVVAVIDTGIDYTHPDLAENMWTNEDEIPGNGKDDDGNGFIDDVYGYDFTSDTALQPQAINEEYAHGTHCAGTIGAVCGNGMGISGIASAAGSVSVMDLKALAGKKGTGNTFDLIRAILYAEKNGADICNLSMGSYADDRSLYNTIAASDMLFVCAAGNDGADLDKKPIFPGCYDLDNVICVGNSARDGSLNSRSNYSSKNVDLAAPGTEIYSTLPAGKYGNMSGTSMAAPFVTGAAALLHSYYDNISAAEMRFLLLDGAKETRKLSAEVEKGRFLDLYKPLTGYRHEDFHIDRKAPTLKASVAKIKGSYKQKLKVNVSDDSGRSPKVRYAKGSQSLTYFRSGMGTKMTLNQSGFGSKVLSVPGTYTVYTADDAGNDVIVRIKCTANAVSSIKLNYSKKTISRGKSYTLKATLSKTGTYGRKLTWTTSKKSVASVSSKGKVTAKKKGTAVITVKTANGLYKRCKIVVK